MSRASQVFEFNTHELPRRAGEMKEYQLDLAILEEEFHSTGDTGFISAILNNPNCTQEILQSIVESDHFIFDDRENEDLVEQAKEILVSRESNTK